MTDSETFIQYPLQLDPTTKAISAPSSSGPELTQELDSLNQLHRALINLDPPSIPPPPRPVNPKRSAQVDKLRETANAAYRKSNAPEAVKLYTVAIEMAQQRPLWEPAGLVREELGALYANRAQAYMAQQMWPEGWVDAQSSVECMEQDNGKGWWRGGKCLAEMGRWEEASDWVGKALEIEAKNSEVGKELASLMEDIEKRLASRR